MDTPEGLRCQAFGGEVPDVVFATPLLAPQLDRLAEIDAATRVERIGCREVRLVVADAGEASPQVTAWATEAGVEIESVEPYLLPSTMSSSS
ncbi:MAG TPA: hypothetical protein VM848_00920 [Acidimicrobiia bacterium]|nr:hypothetical protein [Acidimicrobiia bacterium]